MKSHTHRKSVLSALAISALMLLISAGHVSAAGFHADLAKARGQSGQETQQHTASSEKRETRQSGGFYADLTKASGQQYLHFPRQQL